MSASHERSNPIHKLTSFHTVAGTKMHAAWRTSLHIYVADEALQITPCPRNLCCMKVVLAFKQLRSCHQVSATG